MCTYIYTYVLRSEVSVLETEHAVKVEQPLCYSPNLYVTDLSAISSQEPGWGARKGACCQS